MSKLQGTYALPSILPSSGEPKKKKAKTADTINHTSTSTVGVLLHDSSSNNINEDGSEETCHDEDSTSFASFFV